jgi:hypothetical protein
MGKDSLMAQFDIAEIYGGKVNRYGTIDFDVSIDLFGNGFTRETYTWSPDDTSVAALNIGAYYSVMSDIDVKPYKWEPPTDAMLLNRLSHVVKRLRNDPFLDDVTAPVEFARQVYHNFHDHPETTPEDWEDEKYWTLPKAG